MVQHWAGSLARLLALRDHGVEPLAAEVRVAEEVELVVEPGRVHQLEPLNPVDPQRRHSGGAARNGRDAEALREAIDRGSLVAVADDVARGR